MTHDQQSLCLTHIYDLLFKLLFTGLDMPPTDLPVSPSLSGPQTSAGPTDNDGGYWKTGNPAVTLSLRFINPIFTELCPTCVREALAEDFRCPARPVLFLVAIKPTDNCRGARRRTETFLSNFPFISFAWRLPSPLLIPLSPSLKNKSQVLSVTSRWICEI